MSERCNNSACFSVEIKATSDISVTFVVYACGKSIRNICLHCGERKKPLRGRCFHALILQLYPDGGFEQIKAAVLFAPQTDDALTLARSAAYGGSRHEEKGVSTN